MSTPSTEQNNDQSLGEMLRAEREKQNLRVADLASLANIPPELLQLLPPGALEQLQGALGGGANPFGNLGEQERPPAPVPAEQQVVGGGEQVRPGLAEGAPDRRSWEAIPPTGKLQRTVTR